MGRTSSWCSTPKTTKISSFVSSVTSPPTTAGLGSSWESWPVTSRGQCWAGAVGHPFTEPGHPWGHCGAGLWLELCCFTAPLGYQRDLFSWHFWDTPFTNNTSLPLLPSVCVCDNHGCLGDKCHLEMHLECVTMAPEGFLQPNSSYLKLRWSFSLLRLPLCPSYEQLIYCLSCAMSSLLPEVCLSCKSLSPSWWSGLGISRIELLEQQESPGSQE